MSGVHELDREGVDILLAVVLAGDIGDRETLRALEVAYDVARSTGIDTTPLLVSQNDWLSQRSNWFREIERRGLALLRDYRDMCVEHGIRMDHNATILMSEWATQVRYAVQTERPPLPHEDLDEWKRRHQIVLAMAGSALRHGVRPSRRVRAALLTWARTRSGDHASHGPDRDIPPTRPAVEAQPDKPA